MISNKVYLTKSALERPHTPHEARKDIDYEHLAKAWNAAVDAQTGATTHRSFDTTPGVAQHQDGPATDSSDRIYYKIPTQLKNHHRKLLKYNSARATMLNGLNVKDLEPFMAILDDPTIPLSQRKLPPGIPLEDDMCIISRDGETVQNCLIDTLLTYAGGLDLNSFNSMATFHVTSNGQLSTSDAVYAGVTPATNVESSDSNIAGDPQVRSVAQNQNQNQATIVIAPTGLVRLSNNRVSETMPKDGKRCAICVFNYCPRRNTCPGTGGRKLCRCTHSRTPALGKKVRSITEQKILEFLDTHQNKSQPEREALL
jgi:hypothetical protein